MLKKYDIIVVGAGHAGCEAAAAAANLGSSVLLITTDMGKIAQMSCNPAMGGVAKGQIVREIDALGGYSGIVSDLSTIQFRMLNLSKGPAMWRPPLTTISLTVSCQKSTFLVFSSISLQRELNNILSFCDRGLHIAGPLERFNILNWIVDRSETIPE